MPIDLVCKSCSRLLRVPDNAAGKHIRCPHCQAISEAPQPAEVVEAMPVPMAPGAANNPFSPHPLPPRPVPDLGDNAAVRMLLPVGRSGWAIAAGYAGLFSPLPCAAPVAIVLGVIAIIHIRGNPKLHGMGRAIFGLVMGIIFSIGSVLVLIATATG
jgi:LSD1 subclass zinc finger protein